MTAGSSEAKKVPGLVSFFPRFFLSCFLTPLTEKRPKTWFIKSGKKSILDFGFFVDFFVNAIQKLFDFRHDFFVKHFL
jgi:hypothetical protein